MAAAAKDSSTVKCGLCEEQLEGTAKHPHFTVPPSGCLVSVRKTEHQVPLKFIGYCGKKILITELLFMVLKVTVFILRFCFG